MSKKFRYFSLLMVLIVFLSIGAICATDVNNNTVAISNSSVSNSIQTVTNDTVTNSVNVCDNSTNAMSNSDSGSSSSSIVSSYNSSSNGLDVESSTISSNNSSSSNGLDVESSTISSNNNVGNSNTVSNINNTVLNTIENCSNVSAVNKQLTTTSVSSALVNTGSNITNLNNNTFGVFLFGSNMNSIDLSKLYANHIGNIFLNYYAIETYGVSAVESFIKKARTYNINVYIWMQCFYDGGFINPATCGQSYWTQKINEAKSYAELQGVAGIALDYLRFPGTAYKYSNGTKSINLFTKMLTSAVKGINSNIKVAAIIMPETSSNAYYYGQDSDQLGNIVDIIIPMVYKGNYGESDSWIKSTSTYFKSHSGNAEVWTALQTYDSDSNVVKLSSSVLSTDSQYALNGGADGVVYFRYALFNIFNMTSLSGGISSMDSSKTNSSSSTNSSNPTSFTIGQIVDAARTVR
ncbi:MAG: putative glycoside hydrolase, partial [Methanobrevibacter sp.]